MILFHNDESLEADPLNASGDGEHIQEYEVIPEMYSGLDGFELYN